MSDLGDEPELEARGPDRTRRPVFVLLVLGACAGLVTLILTCYRRVAFPYPLEWMEGASLQHALWLARGRLPYAAPSGELIAYLYPPLAYVPWALVGTATGASLPAARAVSLACSAGAIALIRSAGTRVTGDRAAGLFAAGTFAMGFGYTGGYLDLVRVDACFVLLLAAAAERLSAHKHGAALACLAGSALAKQHGLPLLALVSLALLARDARAHTRAVAAAWLALGAALLALQLASDGWFGRYVFELPRRHGLQPYLLISFALVDLLLFLPVLTAGALALLFARRRALGPLDALLLGACAVSALGRAHPGGDDNVRLPAFALLCVVAAAPLAARALAERTRGAARVGLCAALLAQLAILWQPPSAHAPGSTSTRRWSELHAALQRCARGGRAVALDHALFGDSPFVHTMALSDLRMARGSRLAAAGTDALLSALRGPDAPAALAVGERFPELETVLARRYRLCATVRAPRLATGHQPGFVDGGVLVQEVYEKERD